MSTPTIKVPLKNQRQKLLARLPKLSVRYKKTKKETTIAGGHSQLLATTSSILTNEVIEFEKAAQEEADIIQQTSFMGYVFLKNTQPQSITVAEIPTHITNSEDYTWIDLSSYASTDLQTLAQALQINPIAIQATLSSWKNPRLDVLGDHFFVTATLPHLQSNPYKVQVHQLNLCVGKNFLLSAHQISLPFLDRILTRCSLHTQNAQIDSTFLLYIILDELLSYYEDLNVDMQIQIEQMEERALIDTSDTFLTDLLHFKRYAFALTQLADQHRSIFAVFLRPDFPYISEQEVALYYRDLDAHLARLTDILRAGKESVNGIFNIYVSHVSHHTNNVMKILTIVSTVLLPSTLILTFFSTQTVSSVPLLTHTFGLLLMLTSIFCVSIAILWRFRHKGWL